MRGRFAGMPKEAWTVNPIGRPEPGASERVLPALSNSGWGVVKSGRVAIVMAIAFSIGIVGRADAQSGQPNRLAEAAAAQGHLADTIAADSLAAARLLLKVLPGAFTNNRRYGPGADLSGLRHWDAYSGVVRLREADFYRIVGEGSLAHAVDAARKRRFIAIGIGTASMLVGSLLFTSKPPTGPERPVISVRHLVGGFMIPIGGMTIGLSFMTANRRRIPLGIAQDLAEEYNLRALPAHAGRD